MGYPMVQQWRVRSNLYRVKLSTITLSAGGDCYRAARGLGVAQHVLPRTWGMPGPGLGVLREWAPVLPAMKELTGRVDGQADSDILTLR